MKLSNKILIGFFGFIFIYMTAAFTEIRFRGESRYHFELKSRTEKVDIPNISYLVLPDLGQSIDVIGSDNPRIEIKSLSGDFLQHLKYQVYGDTLAMTESNLPEDQRVIISIYVPKNTLTGLTVSNARVAIGSMDCETLSVLQNDGRLSIHDSKLGRLNIAATNGANFNLSKTKLDTLSAQIDDSQIRVETTVKLVKGSMTNKSYLRVQGTDEIQFKTDKSSRIDLN